MDRLSDSFVETTLRLQQEVIQRNRTTLKSLGAQIGASIAAGGVLHLFGSGHSAIVAQELERRAGGLVPISTIQDPTSGWAETLPGFGKKLFERYAFFYNIQAKETLIVISNSGTNPSPIDIALAARERGLHLVALTSLEMSRNYISRHPSGKRLFEIADDVLDNLGIPGDAAIPLPGHPLKVGPTSTLTGALLLDYLHLEIIQYLLENNHPLPVLMSQNLPEGTTHNQSMAEAYRHRIRRPI